jgi:hypothetical protein
MARNSSSSPASPHDMSQLWSASYSLPTMASERLNLPPVPSAARIITNTDVCCADVGGESRRRGGGRMCKMNGRQKSERGIRESTTRVEGGDGMLRGERGEGARRRSGGGRCLDDEDNRGAAYASTDGTSFPAPVVARPLRRRCVRPRGGRTRPASTTTTTTARRAPPRGPHGGGCAAASAVAAAAPQQDGGGRQRRQLGGSAAALLARRRQRN